MNDVERALGQFENFKRHGYKSSYLPAHGSIEVAMRALEEIVEYEKYNEALKQEYGECSTVLDIAESFITILQGQQDEPLHGFRILTNRDKADYEQWKEEKAAQENPIPLTLEQLKERHKKPVWLNIICADIAIWIICGKECRPGLFYFGNCGEFPISTYGIDWVCYDHEPKEATDDR